MSLIIIHNQINRRKSTQIIYHITKNLILIKIIEINIMKDIIKEIGFNKQRAVIERNLKIENKLFILSKRLKIHKMIHYKIKKKLLVLHSNLSNLLFHNQQ